MRVYLEVHLRGEDTPAQPEAHMRAGGSVQHVRLGGDDGPKEIERRAFEFGLHQVAEVPVDAAVAVGAPAELHHLRGHEDPQHWLCYIRDLAVHAVAPGGLQNDGGHLVDQLPTHPGPFPHPVHLPHRLDAHRAP
eukprot:CAMPEP_0173168262 /NCGR_PEP_ID=MMETSP1141-20130122/45_1 /TAXON_ID=483371 /ORGANISM="non described non described, Strain CCMP2298" /LENGTH=134 /DNA_ID=CAMNT_0014089947 /DNA_START=631 /DNA_END=1035 /DNA_ORIENTATION=+